MRRAPPENHCTIAACIAARPSTAGEILVAKTNSSKLPNSEVPEIRVRVGSHNDVNADGDFVLYWMIAYRRTRWNFSLQRAVDWARHLRKPLIVFEPLRCGYRWGSDRLHHFVVKGMADNAGRLDGKPAFYFPYVEQKAGDGKGLLKALSENACIVVSDDYPCFFLPRMQDAAAKQIPARFELVDSNGILPMRAAEKVYARAVDMRRFLQKTLRPHLADFPKADPLSRVRLPKLEKLPTRITKRWPAADVESLADETKWLAKLPLDHDVTPTETSGGEKAARKQLRNFIKSRLAKYNEARNQPEQQVTSGLSPYLHFGHISAHQVFDEVTSHDDWSPAKLAEKANGSSDGWWGASEEVESFLDELITWREIGFNMCWQREDYTEYESLPDWAKKTLAEHKSDEREHVYELDGFESAETHDPLWNAAQQQLVREGRIHNYLRMLWGKKILEWSATPRDALDVMIELNNKYALDGRDPNSYSGIFWVLGRYDRAWGPERPIFGKIRYMTSENTARKFKVDGYIEKYGAE